MSGKTSSRNSFDGAIVKASSTSAPLWKQNGSLVGLRMMG